MPYPLAPKGNGKNHIHFMLEANYGVIIENDLVVQSDSHLGSETGVTIGIGVSEVFNFIIGTVYVGFLNLYQFG
jgi:hypothetical protein